eukprot:6706243-Prymnesium_polylepis.1
MSSRSPSRAPEASRAPEVRAVGCIASRAMPLAASAAKFTADVDAVGSAAVAAAASAASAHAAASA